MSIIPNTKNKSKRLRKKLHIGEFQILGFRLSFSFNNKSMDNDFSDEVMDTLIDYVEEHQLSCCGGGHRDKDGVEHYSFVITKAEPYKIPKNTKVIPYHLQGKYKDTSVTSKDIHIIKIWLDKYKKDFGLTNEIVGEPIDIWYDDI